MKFPFPLPAPRRDEASLLPALLAGVLVIVLVAQLALPAQLAAPEAVLAPPAQGVPVALSAGFVAPEPVVAARNLFAPGRSLSGALVAGGGGAAAALGGARVAGTLGRGGALRAVILRPDGRMQLVAPGGLVDGWRLVALAGDHAVFARAGERMNMPFGGALPVGPGPAGDGGDK